MWSETVNYLKRLNNFNMDDCSGTAYYRWCQLSCSILQDRHGNRPKGRDVLPGVLKGSLDSTGQSCMFHCHRPLLLIAANNKYFIHDRQILVQTDWFDYLCDWSWWLNWFTIAEAGIQTTPISPSMSEDSGRQTLLTKNLLEPWYDSCLSNSCSLV